MPIKPVFIAGVGFFIDSYLIFSINLVNNVMAYVYPSQADELTISAITTSSVAGTLLGQILFGMLADILGRKVTFVTTACLIIVGALGSCLLSWNVSFISVFFCVGVWRFLLGIGVGGDYPLSASITSEVAENEMNRGFQLATVFSAQGWGRVFAPLVMFFLLKMFSAHPDLVWRLALGFGTVPALVMIWPRLRMQETRAFTTELKKRQPVNWRVIAICYWKKLLGTSSTWFLSDAVLYANGLFMGTLLEMMMGNTTEGGPQQIRDSAKLTLVVALMGIPGYWVSVYYIDRWGRRTLQMWGFALMTVVYMVLGGFADWIAQFWPAFVAMYGLTFFLANAGPSTTTFVLPAELFPTKIRTTCHGMSAASGKVGAIIGGMTMAPLLEFFGVGIALMFCGCLCAAGYLMTVLYVEESVGKTLDELVEEDEELAVLLADGKLMIEEDFRKGLIRIINKSDDNYENDFPLSRIGISVDQAKIS
jgi:PHS family inorganic phosphate transporter-like MFS transporter